MLGQVEHAWTHAWSPRLGQVEAVFIEWLPTRIGLPGVSKIYLFKQTHVLFFFDGQAFH